VQVPTGARKSFDVPVKVSAFAKYLIANKKIEIEAKSGPTMNGLSIRLYADLVVILKGSVPTTPIQRMPLFSFNSD